MSVAGFTSSPRAAAREAEYTKDTGWSSDRSVPSRVASAGIVVTPAAMVIGVARVSTSPRAIVPSWQLRHIKDAPVGWPAFPSAVELVYGV